MSERSRDLEFSPPPEYAYDPELPFLAELEREIRRAARRGADVEGSRRRMLANVPAPTRATRSGHGFAAPGGALGARGGGRRHAPALARVGRRSATLVALLCLIGATAYGAHRVFAGHSGGLPNPISAPRGPFVLAARGDAEGEQWSLRLYRRGEELCRVLIVAETEASYCAAPPGPRTLDVTSLVSPSGRYVFGVAGSAVARVAIHVGRSHRTVTTRTADSARATRAAGLPARVRFFIATLARPLGRADPPALVRGLSAGGAPVGLVHVDCVETPNPRSCPSG